MTGANNCGVYRYPRSRRRELPRRETYTLVSQPIIDAGMAPRLVDHATTTKMKTCAVGDKANFRLRMGTFAMWTFQLVACFLSWDLHPLL